MPDISIRIGSEIFSDWKQVEITRSIDTLCGEFRLSGVDLTTGIDFPFAPLTECEIMYGSQTIMTGIIDDISPELNEEDESLSIIGRDKTSPLVDCSAMNTPGTWNRKTLTLSALANALCQPFGVPVKIDTATTRKFNHTLQAGESPWESINRANEFEGALIYTDERSRLVIGAPGSAGIAGDRLVYGENVKRARGTISYRERFAEYTLKGQTSEVEDGWSSSTVTVKGSASDPLISAIGYRPKLIVSESASTKTECQRRAEIEAIVRAGRSASIGVSMEGWTQAGNGDVWKPNVFAIVDIPKLRISTRKMLISSVTLSADDQSGMTAELSLSREDAYSRIANKQVSKKSNEYGW